MTPSKVEELGEAKRDMPASQDEMFLAHDHFINRLGGFRPHKRQGEKTHALRQERPKKRKEVNGIIDRARQAQTHGDLTKLILIYHEVTTLRHASSRTIRRVERICEKGGVKL